LWYPLRLDSPLWFFYQSMDSLVVRARFTNVLTQYPLATRGRRALTYLKQHGTIIPTLPPESVPICPPTEDRRKWVSTPAAGVNFVPVPMPHMRPSWTPP
jgi:hypothetical protein